LEPSNFSHSCHRTNQAAIPQHVNRPTKQKTQKEDSSNTNNHYTSKFSEFHDVSFLVSIQVLYTQTDLLSTLGLDKILSVMARPGTGCELTDVATLVFPAQQAAGSPTDIGFTLANGFLVNFAVQQNSDMIATIDTTDCDLVFTFTHDTSLDLDQLSVAVFHHLPHSFSV
jgi:hypothetical protein